MTAPIEHMEVQVANMRVAWWRRNLIGGLVVMVVALLIINGVTLSLALSSRASTNAIKKSNAITLCISALTANGIGGIGDAFATPPAPNVDRTAAVQAIIRAVQKLHQAKTICEQEIR